jgi:toxin-antitoxin system PIN domain toxin
VIAVDTNLLVYSHRRESPFHSEAIALIENLIAGRSSWAIPWSCLHEFIGIVTNARIFRTPTPLLTAFAAIDAFCVAENVVFLNESDGYLPLLRQLAVAAKSSGAKIHDARVAALCLHHGVEELWSADRDFSAFPGLRTRNPLVKE